MSNRHHLKSGVIKSKCRLKEEDAPQEFCLKKKMNIKPVSSQGRGHTRASARRPIVQSAVLKETDCNVGKCKETDSNIGSTQGRRLIVKLARDASQ